MATGRRSRLLGARTSRERSRHWRRCANGQVVVDADGRRLSASIRSGDRVVPRAIRALDDAGVDVLDVEVRRPTLDDVFLRLTGHTADGDGNGVGDGEAHGDGKTSGDRPESEAW